MLNKCIIIGRLVRDPELLATQSGTPVASFTLAVDRDFTNKDSGKKETDFIDCVAWKHTGEFVGRYFTKGRMAAVEGRLQFREWTDKSGAKRKSAEILAESVYFADSKQTATNNEKHDTKEAVQTVDFDQVEIDDDELPF